MNPTNPDTPDEPEEPVFRAPQPWPGGFVPPTPAAVPPPPAGGDDDDGPNLSFSLDGWLAEVGGAFQGRIAYHPRADQAGRADGIRLRLAFRTSGVGAAVHRVVAEQRWTMEPGESFGTPFLIGVPGLEPISYDGQLLSIRWEIEVTATRPWRGDHSVAAPVLVVPVGGAALYRTAHPYRPLPG